MVAAGNHRPVGAEIIDPGELEDLRHRLRRAALLTSGAGIGFGVLTILSRWFLESDREAIMGAEDPAVYYQAEGASGLALAGLYLLPFAAIAFLWFIVALRGWIRRSGRRRNMLVSDLQLVSGVAFTAVFLVGSGALATSVVTSATGSEVSFETLRGLTAFGDTLMGVLGVRMAGIFVLATSALGMTTGVLPRWFNIVGYLFGVLLLVSPVAEPSFMLAFPTWVMLMSAMLLFHLANLPDSQLPGFADRLEGHGPVVDAD